MTDHVMETRWGETTIGIDSVYVRCSCGWYGNCWHDKEQAKLDWSAHVAGLPDMPGYFDRKAQVLSWQEQENA